MSRGPCAGRIQPATTQEGHGGSPPQNRHRPRFANHIAAYFLDAVFFAGAFFAAAFFGAAFFFPFAGPFAALASISATASSAVSASGSSVLGKVALVVPSVT